MSIICGGVDYDQVIWKFLHDHGHMSNGQMTGGQMVFGHNFMTSGHMTNMTKVIMTSL